MGQERVKYIDIRAGEPLPGGWDGFRVGSESCPHLLPSAGDIADLTSAKGPRNLSLVTPIAGPDEFDEVLDAVKKAESHGWSEVIVNDWGLLEALPVSKEREITAGRLLMRFRRGPGSSDTGSETDPFVRQYFAWGPLYDSPFLAFLEEKGVSRLELDLPRHWMPMPDAERFRYSLHVKNRLISVSGTCPWLYDEKKGTWNPAAHCGRPCGGQGDIEITTPVLAGTLLLRGKAILEPVRMDIAGLDLKGKVDRIIYDRAY